MKNPFGDYDTGPEFGNHDPFATEIESIDERVGTFEDFTLVFREKYLSEQSISEQLPSSKKLFG